MELFFLLGVDASHVYVHTACLDARLLPQSYQHPNLSEGTDRVGGQLCSDKECPFSGIPKSGRVWRKLLESDAQSVVTYMYFLRLIAMWCVCVSVAGRWLCHVVCMCVRCRQMAVPCGVYVCPLQADGCAMWCVCVSVAGRWLCHVVCMCVRCRQMAVVEVR